MNIHSYSPESSYYADFQYALSIAKEYDHIIKYEPSILNSSKLTIDNKTLKFKEDCYGYMSAEKFILDNIGREVYKASASKDILDDIQFFNASHPGAPDLVLRQIPGTQTFSISQQDYPQEVFKELCLSPIQNVFSLDAEGYKHAKKWLERYSTISTLSAQENLLHQYNQYERFKNITVDGKLSEKDEKELEEYFKE